MCANKSILIRRKQHYQGGFCIDFSSIGKNVRKYRKQRGLTLEALAEKVGLSTNYVGALERGEKALALKTLINIVDALDITADMVLCDVTKNGYKVKSSVLTEKLEALSPSEREKILQMVDIMLDGK